MISEVVTEINSLITLNISKKFGVVERVYRFTGPIAIYPAEYVGKGQYENINLDFHTCVYHRLTGAQTSSESESRTGCGMDLTISQPMRMVLYCPKGILGFDDSSSVFKIASNVRKEMTFNNDSTLATTLKVDYASVLVTSVDFDSVSVWGAEFQNVDFSLRSDMCLIGFDYTIEIKGDKNCILEYECT